MAGHDGAGLQRRDLVERGQPRLDPTVSAFEQVLMHTVVGDVAGDDQADGRDVQHRGVVGVGVADLDGQQPVAFQFDPVDRNGSIVHGTGGNLAGEVDVPHLSAADSALLMHHRDRAVGRIRDRIGKPLQQKVGAEPVIAVSMGCEDGGQVLAGAFDPVADALHLLVGQRRVDQDGVALAVDQRGGNRRGDDRAAVRQSLLAVTSQAVVDQYFVVQLRHGLFLSIPFVPSDLRVC